MAWLYLLAAILLEVCGTTSMKLSRGFSVPGPTVAIFACYAASIVCLTLAVRQLEIGVAYAIWAGLGTAVVAAIGVLWFGEAATLAKGISLVLVIAGVAGLRLSSQGELTPPGAAAPITRAEDG
ncbi:MAG: multidrug efflux SMR transporter [Deltaproteobacteria bacterium]|nr:multidrug efflux SMR transporter [Deltaproteobacteria bacterium]